MSQPEPKEPTTNPGPKKPTVQQSWDEILKVVDSRDDDLVKGYNQDIDTLLVFVSCAVGSDFSCVKLI